MPLSRPAALQAHYMCVEKGKLRFTGKRHALKKYAAYPDALGRAIVNAWQQRGAAPSSGQTNPSCNRMDVRPSLSKSKPCRNACKGKRCKPAAASSVQRPAWLEPSPGQAQASPSSSLSWLTPSPITSSVTTSCARPMGFSAPAWLTPSPSST